MVKDMLRGFAYVATFVILICSSVGVCMGVIFLAVGGDFQRCHNEALAKGYNSNLVEGNVRVDFWNICVVTGVKFENGTSIEIVTDSWRMV